MEKIILGPAMGELDDGTDPAMSIGIATKRADGTDVSLSGLLHPEGSTVEQARVVFEIVEDVLANDLGGELADVTRLRFYVREDVLTTETRRKLHELRHDLFDHPDFPAATMVGVSKLAHEDATVEIEVEAFVPDEEWDTTVITPKD